MSAAVTTTDHDAIRTWIEARRGRPAKVEINGEGGILRVDFAEPDDRLDEFDWNEFFEIFEGSQLAFLAGTNETSFKYP